MNIQDRKDYQSLLITNSPPKDDFLNLSNDQLCAYFENFSFLEEFKLKKLSSDECTEKMTKNQNEVLVKLIQLNNSKTMLEVQNSPPLRYCLLKELQAYFENTDESALFQALSTIDKLGEFISEKNLLKILIFIRENPLLDLFGGKMSRSRPHIRKFHAAKYGIPSDLHVNIKTKAIFVKLELVGKGTYKTVKKNLYFSSLGLQMQVIAKQPNSEIARQELKMLKLTTDLPNVISMDGFEDYKSLKKNKMMRSTIYPMCNMGSLFDHLKSESMTYKVKLKIIADMLKGICGLHERGIIHRDIKPANILLNKILENEVEVIQVFIGDLGLSCQREIELKDYSRNILKGTPFYMPPNLLRIRCASKIPEKVASSDYDMDAWAAGITISEFLYGPHPFWSVKTALELIKKNEELNDHFLNPAPENENSIDYVIWGLRQPDSAKRLSVTQAYAKVLNIIEINNHLEL